MSERKQAKRVSVFLSKEEYERLSNLAQDAYRSLSGYMRWILQQHMEELDLDNVLDKKSKRQGPS